MSKELWFAEYERLLNELEDEGVPSVRASEIAAGKAGPALRERLFDMADREKKIRRGEA